MIPRPAGAPMRRREFITLIGGAAAWPPAARAQQRDRMRRIGILMNLVQDDPEAAPRIGAFRSALGKLGWVEGRNIELDIRWGGHDVAHARGPATELVASAPDVILAGTSSATAAMLEATRTIPIVFANVTDPVSAGYVSSLARPGGNATGFMFV